MVTDLTKGKPFKMILSFCLPLMGGQIFQQLYNMVDSIIVGRFCGTAELSAVGATGSLTFMVIGFVMGCCTGFGIPISQAFGEKDFVKLRKIYANSIYVTFALVALLTTITTLCVGGVLKVMNTPDSIYKMCFDYISIIFYGLIATYFYNLFASVMRALGDSKTPLCLLIFSSVLNIGLDLFFVIVLKMSVKGVAYATVIAQGISAILAYIIVKRKFDVLRFEKGERAFDIKSIGKLLYNGIPMALQISVTAVGSIILQSAVNSFGENVIAAVAVALKIQLMLILPSETIGITMSTYCGQNFGAGQIGRIREGMKKAVFIGFVYCIVSVSIAAFLGGSLAELFVTADQVDVISLVDRFLKISCCFYPALSLLFILRNAIQGLGYSVPAMFSGAFELGARAVMSFVIIPAYGYEAVNYANPAAWCSALIFLIPVYLIVYNLVKKKIQLRESNI